MKRSTAQISSRNMNQLLGGKGARWVSSDVGFLMYSIKVIVTYTVMFVLFGAAMALVSVLRSEAGDHLRVGLRLGYLFSTPMILFMLMLDLIFRAYYAFSKGLTSFSLIQEARITIHASLERVEAVVVDSLRRSKLFMDVDGVFSDGHLSLMTRKNMRTFGERIDICMYCNGHDDRVVVAISSTPIFRFLVFDYCKGIHNITCVMNAISGVVDLEDGKAVLAGGEG